MAHTDVPATNCPNCLHTPVGRYCPACGQRQLAREHYSLRHLFSELLGNLFQWDNKLLRTLVLALRKPGELSALHIAGVRTRYTSPVTLLLLVFFVFFLAPMLSDFTQSLEQHLQWGRWYASAAADWVNTLAATRTGGMTELSAQYADLQQDVAKTMVLLHVPLFALGLHLLHWRRRYYFVEHVIVASHAVITLMLVLLLAVVLLFIPIELLYAPAAVPEPVKQNVIRYGLNLPLLLMLVLILKHAYRQPWWLALLKLPASVLAFGFSHMLYRAATFYTTLLLL